MYEVEPAISSGFHMSNLQYLVARKPVHPAEPLDPVLASDSLRCEVSEQIAPARDHAPVAVRRDIALRMNNFRTSEIQPIKCSFRGPS